MRFPIEVARFLDKERIKVQQQANGVGETSGRSKLFRSVLKREAEAGLTMGGGGVEGGGAVRGKKKARYFGGHLAPQLSDFSFSNGNKKQAPGVDGYSPPK